MQAMSTITALSGLTYFIVMGPVLFLGMVSGALSDVHSRKRLFLVAQWIITVFVGLVCVLVYSNLVESGYLFVWFLVLLLYGCAFAFVPTSRLALVGDIVPTNSIGTVSIIVNVFVLIAFSLAPMLVGRIAESHSWFDVYFNILILFVVSNIALFGVKADAARRKRQTYLRSILGMLRYVFRNILLWRLFVLLSVVFICLIGPFQVVIPEYAKEVLGLNEADKGALLAYLGAGVFVGSVSMIYLKSRVSRGLMIIASNCFAGASFVLFSYVNNVALASALLFLIGCFGGAAYALVPSILQEVVSNQRRGRVMSLYIVFSMGIPALGGLVSSVLVSSIGLVVTMNILGVLGALGVLLLGYRIRHI